MKSLKTTQFGNPILRSIARKLEIKEISSERIQDLIEDMNFTLSSKKLGIGLAAPQIGESLSLAIINIQETKHRKNVEPLKLVIINPIITKTFGSRSQMWEGCISSGSGKAGLFGKALRYKKIELKYVDQYGKNQKEIFNGLPAHVIQHEVDHLNGVLFVDKVKDPTTYMTFSEYVKMAKKKNKNK